MWIVSKFGFFSVAEIGGLFHVRARDRADLDALRVGCGVAYTPIERTPASPYPFALLLSVGQWRKVARALADGVDYPSLREEVMRRPAQAHRLDLYQLLAELLERLTGGARRVA